MRPKNGPGFWSTEGQRRTAWLVVPSLGRDRHQRYVAQELGLSRPVVLRRSAGWARGPAPPRDSDAFRRSRSACARVQGWDAFLARITEALAVRPASGGRWSPRRTLAREPDQAQRLSFAEACGGAVPGRGGAGYRGRCACTAAAMGIASGAQAARRLHRASLALALRCGSDLPITGCRLFARVADGCSRGGRDGMSLARAASGWSAASPFQPAAGGHGLVPLRCPERAQSG